MRSYLYTLSATLLAMNLAGVSDVSYYLVFLPVFMQWSNNAVELYLQHKKLKKLIEDVHGKVGNNDDNIER